MVRREHKLIFDGRAAFALISSCFGISKKKTVLLFRTDLIQYCDVRTKSPCNRWELLSRPQKLSLLPGRDCIASTRQLLALRIRRQTRAQREVQRLLLSIRLSRTMFFACLRSWSYTSKSDPTIGTFIEIWSACALLQGCTQVAPQRVNAQPIEYT